ncbi:MAG: sulfatase-like hydrolase/transferase [Rhodospirillales bacterium]|jgi:choline-sulfatase|nr:sulfatase-like hydrolase/transferase [Rhodospirillaceae bacterium]MBT7486019.1 sulfatase-like hydrolase/transferase [Rhodospirillales bacterium]MBT5034417.1 sulfatase-like hydrolase/transferase [Rhodospirillaceae bacterium]MBT6222050.1 sulfatase-like hydrolase/transferase [Rhodospirillaceae bacterium]MBT6364546.1 sulfatase-like hydrolase/transferase [Rhodospirillaceae bacterium]
MAKPNVLYIMSDQHQQKASGCYGHDFARTPNIDGLAARGTRYTTAYTNSPICVPARATLATGRYVHETHYWDNSHGYEGRVKSWHHMAGEQGIGVTSIGKLHFRSDDDPVGFENSIIPMNIDGGVGDVRGCVKRPMAAPLVRSKTAERIGPGESPYTKYDHDIMEQTCAWLKEKGAKKTDKPWTLMCSFVCPHPPHIAPQEFYDMYDKVDMPIPKESDPDAPLHPWIHLLQRSRNHEDFLTPETKRILMASYYGCVTYLDSNIGKVLAALEEAGLRDNTIVIYASDHGENLGARKLWGKNCMYEESAAVPLIISGPGVPERKVSSTPATLVDIGPTVLDIIGHREIAGQENLAGKSLIELSNAPSDPDRVAFSEFYASGSDRASYMIRKRNFKYIHYVGYDPELFDLEKDPDELNNLAGDDGHAGVISEYQNILKAMLDPDEMDELAYRDQCALVEKHGGREKVSAKGAIQGSPVPGDKAEYLS